MAVRINLKWMQWLLALCVGAALNLSPCVSGAVTPEKRPAAGEEYGTSHNKNVTADHSKFDALKQEFKSGPEVTRACLSCHTEAGEQLQKTIHWRWICPADKEGKLGKAGMVVNNYCVSILSNEPRCTSCHVGYGWKDKTFDLTAQEKIDCLVCHEQTGTYEKFPAGAGNPVSQPTPFPMEKKTYNPPEWNKVAQSVGRPTRKNCGTCHFFGGGGEGVKHGDLDSSMFKPNKALDVHMAIEGENFNCTRCHTTEKHSISGRCYKTSATDDKRTLLQSDVIKRITCVSCHSEKPHKAGVKANDHTDKVACQTCHIPEFARVNSTKMMWDWSKAGQLDKEGKPIKKMQDGRLAGLTGFYMPGRDSNRALNVIGWGAVMVALIAVLGHGAGRVVSRKRREKNGQRKDE